MFSGRLPTEHWITAESVGWTGDRPTSAAKTVQAYPKAWLPESLKERGYKTWGASCNPWVSAWDGFDRGFDHYFDIKPWERRPKNKAGLAVRRSRQIFGGKDHGGREALSRFRSWVSAAGDGPWFTFVNLMEVHELYDPPARFHPLFGWAPDRKPRERRPAILYYQLRQKSLRRRPDAGYAAALRSLYYASARYEDWLVGEFVRTLKERDRPAAVAVVSDHGENLGDHGLFEHHSSLHETLLHVPLALWGHRVEVEEGRVDAPVSLLGLPAWLTALAEGGHVPLGPGGPIMSEYESTVRRPGGVGLRHELRSLMRSGDPSKVPALVHHPGMSVRQGNMKYVAVANGEESLYDLDADPGEEHNVLSWRPEAAEPFREHRQAWEQRRENRPEQDEGDTAGGEIADHLRALGYIE